MKALFVPVVALVLSITSFRPGISQDVRLVPLSPSLPAIPAHSFSTLTAGETLVVDFVVEHCFGSYRNRFEFHGGSPLRVTATDFVQDLDTRTGRLMDPRSVLLGSQVLSSDDARGLDSMLAFYRTRQETGCTRHEVVRVHRITPNGVVAAEKFNNSSCASFDIEGMVGFDEIAQRFKRR